MAKSKTQNPPIGTAPCPFKGCEKVCSVHRYRARTDDEKRQRHAGRMYLRCEDHGVTSDQGWIKANATFDDDTAKSDISGSPDVTPEPTQSTKPAADDDSSWGFF